MILKKNKEVYGDSELTIEEIQIRGQLIHKNVDGAEITLLPVNVQEPMKCYMITERMKRYNVTMVDLVYGQIDLPRLETDPEYQKEILSMLTRDKIENAARTRTGALITGDYAVDEDLLNRVSEGISRTDKRLVCSGSALYERKEAKKANKKTPDTDKQIVTEPGAFFRELVRYVKEDVLKSKKSREAASQTKEKTKRTIYEVFDMIYYPTGAVIVGDTVCNKFTYGNRLTERDSNEAGSISQGITTDCFCASGINMNQLSANGSYRTKLSNALLRNGKKSIINLLHMQRVEKGSYFSYTGDFRIVDSERGAFLRNETVSAQLLDINNRVYQEGRNQEGR